MGKVDWVKGSRKMGRGREEVVDGKVGMLGLWGLLVEGDSGRDGVFVSVGETGSAGIDSR